MSGGHNNDKDRWFTIERVYCIKHVRLVGVLLSECPADRCLLNICSGLTQGQGHTVRQAPIALSLFAANLGTSAYFFRLAES